jgi:hypothetical protein
MGLFAHGVCYVGTVFQATTLEMRFVQLRSELPSGPGLYAPTNPKGTQYLREYVTALSQKTQAENRNIFIDAELLKVETAELTPQNVTTALKHLGVAMMPMPPLPPYENPPHMIALKVPVRLKWGLVTRWTVYKYLTWK